MMPILLFPEEMVTESGFGPVVELKESAGAPLRLTISINRMMEQQTLDLSIWVSPDGEDWGSEPILQLPHRYYCGTYHHVLDLSGRSGVRFLRIEYRLRGWCMEAPPPLSSFEVVAEPAVAAAIAAAS
ncbi:MAG: hypothetical protein IANPNBLG_00408 [Bryobacteraceae bacterium]|nr:hypothetical protein [Bryobacteraceae bacterium]MCC6342603.1 hypothetical protein [Bryobacterales bacterium]